MIKMHLFFFMLPSDIKFICSKHIFPYAKRCFGNTQTRAATFLIFRCSSCILSPEPTSTSSGKRSQSTWFLWTADALISSLVLWTLGSIQYLNENCIVVVFSHEATLNSLALSDLYRHIYNLEPRDIWIWLNLTTSQLPRLSLLSIPNFTSENANVIINKAES